MKRIDLWSFVCCAAVVGVAHAALQPGGSLDDNQHSIVYFAETGEFAFDDGGWGGWTNLTLTSSSGVFVHHQVAPSLITERGDGMLNTDYFFPGIFGSFSHGLVAEPGHSLGFLRTDLSAIAGCGPTCFPTLPDLVYVVPEPEVSLWILLSLVFVCRRVRGSLA